MERLGGRSVSQGIAIAPLYVYHPFELRVEEQLVLENEVDAQLAAYEKALLLADAELSAVCDTLRQHDPKKAGIFLAHSDILHDETIDEEIRDMIQSESVTALWAVERIFSMYASQLAKSKDVLIAERAADIKDVKKRLLRCLVGQPERDLSHLEQPVIVAAYDLLPSDTATLDREKVLGIVTEIGGETSHSAILARSYGIPAVLGVAGLMDTIRDHQMAVLDAVEGRLVTNPSQSELEDYREKRDAFQKQAAETEKYLYRDAFTADGIRIRIGLNLGTVNQTDLSGEAFSDYVGLFRTEFLYMGSDHFPTEEEQFVAYRKILQTYGDRPVTIRTLDIGGDKSLSYLPLEQEQNPFLGNRALRLCFSRPDLFQTQLRALLRASVYGNLHIMLPMVASLDDIRRAKLLIAQAEQELISEGVAVSKDYQVGIMIEIPAIALIADLVAKEVDFASIGTNDLCQYTMAADRGNPRTAEYFQRYHPAMFRLMGHVIRSFNKEGKSISVCGELGGDCLAASVLVGLGMRQLSMSPSAVASLKQTLSALTIDKMEHLAEVVCDMDTASNVEQYLRTEII